MTLIPVKNDPKASFEKTESKI